MYQMSRIGPGPAGYGLPPTIGFDKHDPRKTRKPMYTINKRPTVRYDTTGPGPAVYGLGRTTRTGNPYSPAYSCAYRYNTFAPDRNPGPGAHDNHIFKDSCLRGNRAPTYQIGKRLPEGSRDPGPGPNAYKFETNTYKNRQPAYLIGQRTKTPYGLDSPGPAAYNATSRNVTHRQKPAYSMTAARGMPVTNLVGPGPAEYNLMNLKPGASGPKWDFGVRHSMWRPPMIIPGDNC